MFLNDCDTEIRRYFLSPFKNFEFTKAIESVLNAEILARIDDGTFNLSNAIINCTDKETGIIKSLVSQMTSQLQWTYRNNTTGYFGVIANHKRGCNWSYLNLIENRYRYADVIYAKSLAELERKVMSEGHIWYVFDETLARASRRIDEVQKPKAVTVSIVKTPRKPKRESKFKGLSAVEEIKKKRALQDEVLRRNSRPTSMIEKMFI